MEAIMKFWAKYLQDLPHIAKFGRYCMTLIPSSAAAERVFSVLKARFPPTEFRGNIYHAWFQL